MMAGIAAAVRKQTGLTSRRRCRLLLLLCAILPVTPGTAEDYAVDASTGYRMERYRAPVPSSIPGGSTLDTAAVRELQATNAAVLIDVFPPKGLGADPLDGQWLISEPHSTIAGASWLPEVGRGHLEPAYADYFKRNLARLSQNSLSTPLVFFCTSDCWQSWNAAKRAIEYGYENVNWFPLGTDGWQDEGGSLVDVVPVNFLDEAAPERSQAEFPATADILLVDQSGQEQSIGQVTFATSDGETGIDVNLDSSAFSEHFLSMRPFRCLSDASEWFCHLPYPYTLKQTVTPDDLTDLEYQLLFILKKPSDFGIDAWNGLYYRLEYQDDGSITGALWQGDLNTLAEPPEPYSYPIDLSEFIDDGAEKRRFPTLVIRP